MREVIEADFEVIRRPRLFRAAALLWWVFYVGLMADIAVTSSDPQLRAAAVICAGLFVYFERLIGMIREKVSAEDAEAQRNVLLSRNRRARLRPPERHW